MIGRNKKPVLRSRCRVELGKRWVVWAVTDHAVVSLTRPPRQVPITIHSAMRPVCIMSVLDAVALSAKGCPLRGIQGLTVGEDKQLSIPTCVAAAARQGPVIQLNI